MLQTFSYASKFTGRGLHKWQTGALNNLQGTFRSTAMADVDLGGWNVTRVTSLVVTFDRMSKFTGAGLNKWNIAKVKDMTFTFKLATSLTSCNKRKIADAWTTSAVFKATTYGTDWAADTCLCEVGLTWSRTGNDPCTVCAANSTCGVGVKTGCTTTTNTVCKDSPAPCVAALTFNAVTGKEPCKACAASSSCTHGVKSVCTATDDMQCTVPCEAGSTCTPHSDEVGVLKQLNDTFTTQLASSNVSAALNTLRDFVADSTTRDTGTGTRDKAIPADTSLLLVNNLYTVAALPNSTADRRRQVAAILSESVFNIAAAATEGTAGSSSSTSLDVNNQILTKTLQVVISVVSAATRANTELVTATAQALLEASSSVLRSTSDSGDDARSDRQAIIPSVVEAVIRATNTSTPSTTMVARSISAKRETISSSSGTSGDGSFEFRSYGEKEGISSGTTGDVQGLAPSSRIRISLSLFTTGTISNTTTPGGGDQGSGEAFVFQYAAATNPFDEERVESDVVVLRTGTRTALAPTGVGRRRQLSSSSSQSTKGNVTIELYTRDRNTSSTDAPDECGAVFSVNASAFIGLEAALTGACATWNASALKFEANQECNLTNATMSDSDGRWLLQCDCAVATETGEHAMILAIAGYVEKGQR
jgi:hypothetical protein